MEYNNVINFSKHYFEVKYNLKCKPFYYSSKSYFKRINMDSKTFETLVLQSWTCSVSTQKQWLLDILNDAQTLYPRLEWNNYIGYLLCTQELFKQLIGRAKYVRRAAQIMLQDQRNKYDNDRQTWRHYRMKKFRDIYEKSYGLILSAQRGFKRNQLEIEKTEKYVPSEFSKYPKERLSFGPGEFVHTKYTMFE